ncbi:PQQ-binding-like beta-propeller repeat protein [Thermomonospora curvata]|uniref:Pyrrolo-quinoline quinone repeat domain-containing protein n=2 Tax=Thermomonospora TaxID=2019 RepID=D1A9Q4_THECD|nr:PQQ-binding-like beta-propeller repeat protein [Thermomonospora curvata]ACY98740.1 hypothetical protein Tcur_3199 [Thermomonospora curvata DSM 43183]
MSLPAGLRIGAAIAAALAPAACTSDFSVPDLSVSDVPHWTPRQEGPPPRWSAQMPTGSNTTVLMGRVAVVLNDEAVVGLDAATGRQLWSSPSSDQYTRRVTDEVIVDWRKEDLVDKGPFTVIDPATGRTLWRGGPALLDMATGRTRWTAPDPGVTSLSPPWGTRVTGGLVAVGTVEDKISYVLVYRAADGERVGRPAAGPR